MENQDYQKIFEETRNLHEKQLEEKLLSFANGNKQMEEEMQAMFARIKEYHEVLKAYKDSEFEVDWWNKQLQEIVDEINKNSQQKLTAEDIDPLMKEITE